MQRSNKYIIAAALLLNSALANAQSIGPTPAAASGATTCGGLSDASYFCSGTDASHLTGTISSAQLPAFTGDVTKPSGSSVTTLATAQPAVHTWALAQTFTTAPVFTDASGSRTALGLVAVASSGSASDLSAGTLASARGGAGSINGALKGNGSGVVSQAACADLSGGCIVSSAVVNSTYNLTTASGTQTVSGFGFTPSSCNGFGSVNAGTLGLYTTFNAHSDSALTQSALAGVASNIDNFAGLFFAAYDATGSNNQAAQLTAYNSNSITLTWTKTGSPTGTFTFSIRCFK